MRQPYLVQRAEFKDVPEESITGIDSLLSYDYMGSAEFEFGALFHALEDVCNRFYEFEVYQIEGLKDYDGQQCYAICRKEDLEDVTKFIKNLAADEHVYRTKEMVRLQEYVDGKFLTRSYSRIGFWWAFGGSFHQEETEWMCCFGDDMRRLVKALRGSYTKKKGKEPKKDKGPVFKAGKLSRPDPDLTFDDDPRYQRWTIYHENSARKSYVAKRNIIGYEEEDDKVVVTVISKKTCSERKVNIYCKRTPRRKILLKEFDQYIEINNRERTVANG